MTRTCELWLAVCRPLRLAVQPAGHMTVEQSQDQRACKKHLLPGLYSTWLEVAVDDAASVQTGQRGHHAGGIELCCGLAEGALEVEVVEQLATCR